jgi:hypothetical protein
MSAATKTYPITQGELPELCQKIAANGGPTLDPSQPTGKATTHGVTLGWDIQPTSIAITILGKPWFVSNDTIFGEVDKFVTGH